MMEINIKIKGNSTYTIYHLFELIEDQLYDIDDDIFYIDEMEISTCFTRISPITDDGTN